MDTSEAPRDQTYLKLMSAIKAKPLSTCPSCNLNVNCTREHTQEDDAAKTESRGLVVAAWEAVLLRRDDCFLYIGDTASEALFKTRTGLTPRDFASAFLKNKASLLSFYEVVNSKEDLLQKMLDFWADRAKQWRAEYKSKEDALEAFRKRYEKEMQDLELLNRGGFQGQDRSQVT